MRIKTVTTAEQIRNLLEGTDDETVIMRDKGGYVWVSSGYTQDGIFLTLSQGPFDAGTPLSIGARLAGDRIASYGPFRVVYDTREDPWDRNGGDDGAPQAPELVTDPHDLSSYPWNQRAAWTPEFRERVATKYDQARELLCEQQHLGLDFGAAAIVVADLTSRADELRNP